MFDQVQDYTTAGQNPLSFTRYYNSMNNPGAYAAALGTNWRSTYDRYLHILNPGAIYGVLAERPDGQGISFSSNAGVYTTDSDLNYSLTNSGSTWTLTDQAGTTEIYYASGGEATLQSITLRNGYMQALTYAGGQLSYVSDSYSRKLGMAYSSAGLLTGLTTPDSPTTPALTYGYVNFSSTSLLSTVAYNTAPATQQSYLYENASYPYALTGIIDENGIRYASWGYDGLGHATSSQLAGGVNLTQISYNSADGSRAVTGPLGIVETYKFTPLQGVPKVTEIDRAANGTVAAASRLFTYDGNGYLASATDWNGNLTTYQNNAQGLPLTISFASTSPVSYTESIAYDGTWANLAHSVTLPGATTTNSYDGNGNLLFRSVQDTTATTVPYSTAGQVRGTAYTWNGTGQLLTARLPRAAALTTFGYTGGTLTSIMDAAGHTTTITGYKPGGLPTLITDPNGVQTGLAYSSRLWLTATTLYTSGGNFTTGLQYDSAGNLTRTTPPDSAYLAYAYDAAHRPITVTNALNETQNITYDSAGNLTQTQWKNAGGTLKFQFNAGYDALGRALTATDGAGDISRFTYDSQGDTLTVKTPKTYTYTQSFDALNRLATVTDPLGSRSATAYNAGGLPTSVIDFKSNTTSYVYNGFGDTIQQVSPDTGSTVYYVDPDSNVTGRVQAGINYSSATYDTLDRIATRTYPADTAENVAFTYDQAGHGSGIGRLTSVTDAAGSLSRAWNQQGLISSDARTIGAATYTTSYTYYKTGAPYQITYPAAAWQIAYNHDPAGQVLGVTATQPGQAAVNLATLVKHNPFGPVIGFTYGNGATDTRTYDKAYRALTLVDTGTATIQNLAYGYDADSNVHTITDAVTTANNQTLGYDTLDRLSSAVGGYGTISAITYDSNSNRTTYGATSYTIPATSNRMSAAGSSSIGYTAAGNVSSFGATSFTYNKANQLSAIGSATNTYDYAGWRQKAVSGSNSYINQYDQAGRIIENIKAGTEYDYVYLDGSPLAVIAPGGTPTISALHPDRLGTVQKATSAAQALVWGGNYDPNGAVTPSPATINQDLRFPGQTAESGGYNFNLYRDYIPGTGRYLQSDLLGLRGGQNTYLYGNANPFKFTDRLGLSPDQEDVQQILNQVEGGAGVETAYQREQNMAAGHSGAIPVIGSALEAGVAARLARPAEQCTAPAPKGPSGTAVAPYFPPNNGFLNPPIPQILQPGELIDRYGFNTGAFASPAGTPAFMRTLSPAAAQGPLNTFVVAQPFTVQSGIAAPGLGQIGGGIQYELPGSVQTLLDMGYITPVGQ